MLYRVFLILAIVAGMAFAVKGQKAGRPNIVFILADDLGYGDLGCYGQRKIATPNIDALAAGGLRFTQFYAGTAVCAPSRASFMTGLHTGHTAVRGNRGFEPEGQYPLPDGTQTIARQLSAEGYVTADFGKWGLGYPGSSGEPLKQGFSTFYGYNCQSLAHSYYPDHLWSDNERVELAANKEGDAVYSADLIHGKAMDFLRHAGDRPFFLWLSYTLPHAALSVPHDTVYDRYVAAFGEAPLSKDKVKPYEKAAFEPYPHAAYAAMVSRLDRYVGELMHALEAGGLADNTLIIFSSDNGPHREGGNDPDFFVSNGGYRGIKRDLYEGGIRVPFIASWKGVIKPGGTSDYKGAFWDLFPTFQQLAGGERVGGLDGVSLVPLLKGKGKQPEHAYLYWEFHENDGRQALRLGKWKGLRLGVGKTRNGPIELYDMDADPLERLDVSGQHPDIAAKIAALMAKAHRPARDWPLLVEEVDTIRIH